MTDRLVQSSAGGVIVQLAGKAQSPEEGCAMMLKVIGDGSALAKFRDMIVAQGVAQDVAQRLCDVSGDVWKVLEPAAHTTTLKCPQAGEWGKGGNNAVFFPLHESINRDIQKEKLNYI